MPTIPIRNIYYMLLYAFDKIKNKDLLTDRDIDEMNHHSDVLIFLFIKQVSRITQKGILKAYKETAGESLYVKGKINVRETIRKRGPHVSVIFDEYSMDIPLNRIIKKTLHNLLTSRHLVQSKRQVMLLKSLYSNFNDVSLMDDVSYHVRFGRHDDYYQFAISLAYFINEKVIPKDSEGEEKFLDFLDDEETMHRIYEAFLKNFYRYHTNYSVSSKRYDWYLIPIHDTTDKLLPELETDIEILLSNNKKIIIDAKYYKNAFQHKYGTQKLISSNLYQMNTYLSHNLGFDFVRGVLLYPSNGYSINAIYDSQKNYSIEVYTLDLSQSWNEIESDLMSILKADIEKETISIH